MYGFHWRRRRDSKKAAPFSFAPQITDCMSVLLRLRRTVAHGRTEFESLYKKIIPHTKRCMRLFGAEGETRTLAPVSRPTPLAGAPRHQLEYFCKCNGLTDIQFAQAVGLPQPAFGGESGIRTHGTLPYDGFQDRSVITTSVSLLIMRELF